MVLGQELNLMSAIQQLIWRDATNQHIKIYMTFMFNGTWPDCI